LINQAGKIDLESGETKEWGSPDLLTGCLVVTRSQLGEHCTSPLGLAAVAKAVFP